MFKFLIFLGFCALVSLTHQDSAAFAMNPSYEVFPPFVQFPSVDVGGGRTDSFTIRNLGDQALTDITVLPTGFDGDFDIQPQGCEFLAARQTCTVWVWFHPMVIGFQTLTVTVSSGAYSETVDVSGDAYQPGPHR